MTTTRAERPRRGAALRATVSTARRATAHRSGPLRLVLPAALEPDLAILPVVDHQERAGRREEECAYGMPAGGGEADGRPGGQEDARGTVVAALAGDPEAAAGAVVGEEVGRQLHDDQSRYRPD